jgi:hypothetical protein
MVYPNPVLNQCMISLNEIDSLSNVLRDSMKNTSIDHKKYTHGISVSMILKEIGHLQTIKFS